ncbi:MAG: Acetolactate synthase [Anaerolineales bacterium]|nr:Acetolactate synthase [Anaerolineales bacterium]
MESTVADAIATGLRRYGVEVVFGLPGGESVDLVAALERASIRFVLVRHEARSAWMADGYSRIGCRVGVCLSTLGPGAANLAAGLAHCYLDRSPVLAITAQLSPELLEHHSHQRLDLHPLFAPVTKASWAVHPEDDVTRVVDEAVRLTRAGRPGPVRLELPASVVQSPARPRSEVTADGEPAPRRVSRDVLQQAIAHLRRARRPAVLAGLGLEPSAPYGLLRRLAESLGAPVVVTPKAKGVIPEEHALYAGVIGLERREPSAELLRQADLILAVGFDPVELVMPWDFQSSLIFAAEFANEDPRLPSEVELIGDLGATLQTLAQESYETAAWSSEELAAARPVSQPPGQPRSQRVFPSQVMHAVRELLPDDGIATCDVGSHKLLIGKLWPARGPNRFLISNGLSTMGYALPAAIGAKMARPDVPVVCFIGDGGMGMVVSELETAARLQLPIVAVVLADQAMSLIQLKQEMAGYPPTGTLLGPTDWCKIAQGFGARGVVASSVAEVKAAIVAGLRAEGPTLIEARIDASEYRSY